MSRIACSSRASKTGSPAAAGRRPTKVASRRARRRARRLMGLLPDMRCGPYNTRPPGEKPGGRWVPLPSGRGRPMMSPSGKRGGAGRHGTGIRGQGETMFTLNQLRIFWALAHSPSLTQAAKQLGVSQPSLSQQLAKLERSLGTRLFDRVNNQMVITDAGRFLLGKAETMLAEADEIETGLAAYREGRRGRIAVGALASLARNLLPDAWRRARERIPDLEIDVHELPPRDAVEQLYGRTVQMALLSEESLTRDHLSFARIPLAEESYVLATPAPLRLEGVTDPERDLDPEQRRLLARSVRFN
ncbi:MAG TPA: LysR family transcriptional regulator, partial [Rhodospirillales bacterium]|nr:LysR family transcriptional regulator [Rhodospirillales bacterium]